MAQKITELATWISVRLARMKQSVSFFERKDRALKLPVTENDLPPVLEELSGQRKQQREDLLSKLRNQPPPVRLRVYQNRLKKGSPNWDIGTFIEGAKEFASLANLSGSKRVECYGHPVAGLHYANSFTAIWNKTYPQQPITVWDQNFRRQCPPSWSSGLREGLWVLSYQGEAPLSQGLNELLQGPTTLDCGMFCQFILWMALRYLVGDTLFDELFKFQKGQFTLTQAWDEPINQLNSRGNMLYPFYDDPPFEMTTDSSQEEPRIQTRTVFNHRTYPAKHPGGEALLHNGTRIDGEYMIFDPDAPKTILSRTELEQRLRKKYNTPRNSADLEKLWLYELAPDFIHTDFAPKSLGILAEEARDYEYHTLSETDWGESRTEREEEARELQLVFNFQRLISSVREAQEAHLNGATIQDVLSRAAQKRRQSIARRKEPPATAFCAGAKNYSTLLDELARRKQDQNYQDAAKLW
jgi:hypothetical protein